MVDIEDEVKWVMVNFERELMDARQEFTASIMDDQPLETKDRFVQYLGNTYFPELLVRDVHYAKDIPFPGTSTSCASAHFVQADNDLRAIVQPTADQLIELPRIETSRSEALGNFDQ